MKTYNFQGRRTSEIPYELYTLEGNQHPTQKRFILTKKFLGH